MDHNNPKIKNKEFMSAQVLNRRSVSHVNLALKSDQTRKEDSPSEEKDEQNFKFLKRNQKFRILKSRTQQKIKDPFRNTNYEIIRPLNEKEGYSACRNNFRK